MKRKKCECGNWLFPTKNNYTKCHKCRYKDDLLTKPCRCGKQNYNPKKHDRCVNCRRTKEYILKYNAAKGICYICKSSYPIKYKNLICNDCKDFLQPDLYFCRSCKKIYNINSLPSFYKSSTAPFKTRCYPCYKSDITRINNKKVSYKKLKKLDFCEKIRKDPNNEKLGQVKCTEHNCREWFNPTNWEFTNRRDVVFGIKTGELSFYCSNECKQECEKYGSKGHTAEYYLKDTPNWENLDREVQSELREMVLERDDYTCQRCGSKERLECHHVEGIRWNPIESADIDKCITFCYDCHKWVHMNIEGCGYHDLRCKK